MPHGLVAKSALVLEIIQSETTAAEASRQLDLTHSEIESRGDVAKLRAEPQDVREQQLKGL